MIKPLIWSEPTPPSKESSYDHCSAMTPLGEILITWKSWKRSDYFVVETPWREFITGWHSLEEAKTAGWESYSDTVRECLE